MATFQFETSIGVLMVQFGKNGVSSLTLSDRGESTGYSNDFDVECCDGWDNALLAVNKLKKYFNGIDVDFSSLKLDLLNYSSFFRAVCEEVSSISYGSVSTYGSVAENIGKNGAARAVGRVMAGNPIPVIIPCHRVVASGGALLGYSATGGTAMKEFLLKLEKSEYYLKSI